MSMSIPIPGSILCTPYGPGVILHYNDVTQVFACRIWRQCNKSIASESMLYFHWNSMMTSSHEKKNPHPNDSNASILSSLCKTNKMDDGIWKMLPAVPGMHTTLKQCNKEEDLSRTHVQILSYSISKDTYLVQRIPNNANTNTSNSQTNENEATEIIEVNPEDLEVAKAAKFYPFMVDLLHRGDEATKLLLQPQQQNVDTKAIVNQAYTQFSSFQEGKEIKCAHQVNVDKVLNIVKDTVIGDKEQQQHIISDQVNSIWSMLKDEEMGDLLQKAKQRLTALSAIDVQSLVSNSIISKEQEENLSAIGIEIASDVFGIDISERTISDVKETISSREKTISAIDEILHAKASGLSTASIQKELESQFSIAFDHISDFAKNDHYLASIFNNISDKTSSWQEATGRLLETTTANIFFEGTQRLQMRAARIFSQDQLNKAHESAVNFMKAFAEGENTVARLKTIELADAVRDRLVSAIELRSESQGGLDGIIASTLTSIHDKIGESSNIQMFLSNMENSASSSVKDAQETLIATLSSKSKYRDQAMIGIEKTFVDIDAHVASNFGDMTAEDIARIARGEEGTAALLNPLAERAKEEIDRQLTVAENSTDDKTILTVLSHVRRIISGTMSLDEVISMLDDESIATSGEEWIKKGEEIFDALESVKGKKIMDDVLGAAAKAGVTEEAVSKQLESLDIKKLMETTETAINDREVRMELISSVCDTALDFLIKFIPAMPVPAIEGVKDGVIYSMSNLSLEGLKIRKESVTVEIAGISANKEAKKLLGFDDNDTDNTSKSRSQDVLVIEVDDILAVINEIEWGLEQTYFPRLHAGGNAFVGLKDASIRLVFELRRKLRNQTNDEWEPVLCLNKRQCSVGDMDVKLGGSSLSWVLNLGASIFKSSINAYVVQAVLNTIESNSGYLLEKLNGALESYWGVIMRTAELSLDDLETLSDDCVSKFDDPSRFEIELVWRDYAPLGINLLMNDDSGLIKVVEFPRGSQARSVATSSELDPDIFKGAIVATVNGSRYDKLNQPQLVEALKHPGRPKSIGFRLADAGDAEKVLSFVARTEERKSRRKAKDVNNQEPCSNSKYSFDIHIQQEGQLGITFANAMDDLGLIVTNISSQIPEIIEASHRGYLQHGFLLNRINSESVIGENGEGRKKALTLFQRIGNVRPLSLSFSKPYLYSIILKSSEDSDGLYHQSSVLGPSNELVLTPSSHNKKIYLSDFKRITGVLESSGVFIGDRLIAINDMDISVDGEIGANDYEDRLARVSMMIHASSSYPLTFHFSRPTGKSTGTSTCNFHTFSVTVFHEEDIGCKFGCLEQYSDCIAVESFFDVKGPIQKLIRSKCDDDSLLLRIDAVDGQVAPSYVTPGMMLSVLQRRWESNGKVELVLFDEKLFNRIIQST